MSITDSLFKTIVAGKQGINVCIPTGLDCVDKYT